MNIPEQWSVMYEGIPVSACSYDCECAGCAHGLGFVIIFFSIANFMQISWKMAIIVLDLFLIAKYLLFCPPPPTTLDSPQCPKLAGAGGGGRGGWRKRRSYSVLLLNTLSVGQVREGGRSTAPKGGISFTQPPFSAIALHFLSSYLPNTHADFSRERS